MRDPESQQEAKEGVQKTKAPTEGAPQAPMDVPSFLTWVPTASTETAPRVLTAPTDGSTVSIAPVDKGVWFERWADPANWTKDTEPLPGDAETPEAEIAKEQSALAAKRKSVIDANSARATDNLSTTSDPAIAKKLKSSIVIPTAPNEYATDAEYNKVVARYNFAITNAKWVVGKSLQVSTLDALDPDEVSMTSIERDWITRGLPRDFYLRKIPDDLAQRIHDFRLKNVPASELEILLGNECTKELRDLASGQLKYTDQALKTATSHVDTLTSALTRAQAKKNNDKEIDSVESKLNDATKARDALVVNKQLFDAQMAQLQGRGALATYRGGMSLAKDKRTDDEFENAAIQEGVDRPIGTAYGVFGGREGSAATVVAYDATFSWGVGFSVSSGAGYVTTPIKQYDAKGNVIGSKDYVLGKKRDIEEIRGFDAASAKRITEFGGHIRP